ncbi:MAG: sigma-70 family RNA polymerase sigma factor [Brevinematales bacterium]|jgi:RNA polymerase sigma factor (sigma-70 family)
MEESILREFESFFKNNENVLYRIVRGFTDSKDSAKEIVLEALMAVYERWEKVRTFENKTGYAVRIAVNRAKKRYLVNKVKSWLIFLPDEDLIDKENGLGSPEVSALKAEQEEWLGNELDRLRADEKRIILLKDLEKLKFEEIGSALNLKLPTVKSIYRRGKNKLKDRWEDRYEKQ